VLMGLLIDECGIPLGYELFSGNTSEFKTLLSSLNKLKKQYKVEKVIVVADRGLNSKSNLARIKEMGFEYVLAFKIRGASDDVKA
ncbi:transposase, partial [Cloacibacillus evryensis]